MMRKIAIIGGSGYVGSSLAKQLEKGFEVSIFDQTPPKRSEHFKKCDIRDKTSLVDMLDGFDLVINTAIIQVPMINEKKRLGYETNVIGVQNICEAVESVKSIKGLLHAGSWHVFGEMGLRGTIDEEFGFRPDKVEERARFYAFCKIAQETIIRIYGAMSTKSYGVVRLGTVLGEGMPKLTAANLFIDNALKGEPMTPFKHTQYRPMLYVDIMDVCAAFESLTTSVSSAPIQQKTQVVNLVWPKPITIIELARIVQKKLVEVTGGKVKARIKVVDTGVDPIYTHRDAKRFRANISKAQEILGTRKLTDPQQTIERILRHRLATTGASV